MGKLVLAIVLLIVIGFGSSNGEITNRIGITRRGER